MRTAHVSRAARGVARKARKPRVEIARPDIGGTHLRVGLDNVFARRFSRCPRPDSARAIQVWARGGAGVAAGREKTIRNGATGVALGFAMRWLQISPLDFTSLSPMDEIETVRTTPSLAAFCVPVHRAVVTRGHAARGAADSVAAPRGVRAWHRLPLVGFREFAGARKGESATVPILGARYGDAQTPPFAWQIADASGVAS